jgi:hypothetical protein
MSNSWRIPAIVPGKAQFTRILPGLNQESSGILLEEKQPGMEHLVDNGCEQELPGRPGILQEYMGECKELGTCCKQN